MKKDTILSLASPIMIGLFPIGVTFGLLGYQQGMSFFTVVGFSFFVYAGSSQFAVLGLLADGINSPLQIFLTTWLVNLRHVVLSLAYLPNTKKWSLGEKARFFPLLTDETFAVLSMSSLKKEAKPSWLITAIVFMNWWISTGVGYLFGRLFPDPKLLGLDFALCAMFLGIIVLYIKKVEHLITLAAAIALTLLFYFPLNFGKSSIIFAAVCASFIGAVSEWKRTPPS